MNVVAKELMCPRERVFFSLILSIIIGDADPSPRRDPCVVAAMDKFTWTTESCGGKGMAQPLSRGEHPDPCLDRLLFLFWAHYIEEDPHLLCTGPL